MTPSQPPAAHLLHLARPLSALMLGLATLCACERAPQPPAAPPEAARAATASFLMSTHHACALADDGQLWCAGANDAGQLGDNTTQTRGELRPVEGLNHVVGVALSPLHATCAWEEEGALWCWGGNESSLLGPGVEQDHSPLPLKIQGLPPVTQVTLGAYHACALTTDAQVYCWGENRRGQLGRGQPSLPDPTPTAVPGLTDVRALSAGLEHTCALTNRGAIHCWGHNRHHALGLGPQSPNLVSAPTELPLSEPAHALAAAGYHTCAATGAQRALVCWGDNSFGQLGLGDRLTRAEPSPVPGAFGLAELATSGAITCFRDIEARVYCAGGSPDAPVEPTASFQLAAGLSSTRAIGAAMGGVCGIHGDHEIVCRKLDLATEE
ncbi:hypothetical protein DL240_07420 [Lujinxingia litoralis]|uniref:RCC1-like domain-containing protein n=1 Tax=Lujinxingia litoralis TaxID=2211119 RepID=A0A328C906_9DELT|nr:hypothetical protein [Lujinxingia litoralis]RAL23970.1 hypothetical protein DL240_07420 [Lujinxingia litoralis]